MRFIPQLHYDECALACLAMILDYYNCPMNYFGIRILISKSPTLYDMRFILLLNGLESKSCFVPSKDLQQLTHLPAIIHTRSLLAYHFLVIAEVKKTKSLVYDPGLFREKWIANKKIEKRWTGYYLNIKGKGHLDNRNNFYLPYPFRLFLKVLIIGLICIFFIILL